MPCTQWGQSRTGPGITPGGGTESRAAALPYAGLLRQSGYVYKWLGLYLDGWHIMRPGGAVLQSPQKQPRARERPRTRRAHRNFSVSEHACSLAAKVTGGPEACSVGRADASTPDPPQPPTM